MPVNFLLIYVILPPSLPPSLPLLSHNRVHTTNPELGKRAQKVDLPYIACDVCTLVMGEVRQEGREGGRVGNQHSARLGAAEVGAPTLTLPSSLPLPHQQLHDQTAVLAIKPENLFHDKPKKSMLLKLTKKVCDHASFEGRWISYYDIQVGREGGREGEKRWSSYVSRYVLITLLFPSSHLFVTGEGARGWHCAQARPAARERHVRGTCPPSLPHFLPPSLPSSLPPSLRAGHPFFLVSLTRTDRLPSLLPYLPSPLPSFSFFKHHSCFLTPLPHSLPPSFTPSLPPSLPPSL